MMFQTQAIDMDLQYDEGYGEEQEYAEDPAERSDSVSDAFIFCRRKYHVVDIRYIASKAGVTPEEVVKKLEGKAIFQDPAYFADKSEWTLEDGWVFHERYLSGFGPEKLRLAEQMNRRFPGHFTENIKMWKRLIEEHGITEQPEITLGSPFIPCEIYASFIQKLLRLRKKPIVRFNPVKSSYEVIITAKDDMDSIRKNKLYSTLRMNALDIIIKTLNAATLKIYDESTSYSGKVIRIFNAEQTYLVQEIQKRIIAEFKRFVEASETRMERIREAYIRRFSGYYSEAYDGSYLTFPDLNPEIIPYSYQKNAVACTLESEGNRIFIFPVGAGKTYIIIISVHELHRTGLSTNNLVVVPNNILQDVEAAHRLLYPNDEILVATPSMFNADRQGTLEKIRDGRYVAVYMAYSSFNRIKMSKAYRARKMSQEIAELRAAAAGASTKTEGDAIRSKADRLSMKLYDFIREYEDPGFLCFDQLNIQTLFVDEAHNFKNISIKTRADNIVGMRQKGSARADEMLEKVHYVDRAIFTTGTPLCNSLADLYTLMLYLQPEQLKFRSIDTFDMWINTFGEQISDFELDVAVDLRVVTRFASFHNLNELMSMFSMVCDFGYDVRPPISVKVVRETVEIKMLPEEQEYIRSLADRVDLIRRHKVKRTEDNLLKVTTDGRKCTLDPRLVGIEGDFSGCKVDVCADKVAEIYRRFPDKAQVVFCDIGTPKSGFNLYDTLRYKLVERGMRYDEIAFVHSANNEQKRLELFRRVNSGEIKVIVGSTEKLGVGVNIQERLVAIHHLSIPWRPSDLEQRRGRMERSGNTCETAYEFNYIKIGSLDGYLWQKLESKQRFIASFLSGSASVSKVDDIADTVLSYSEIKALAIGNPLIKVRVETANRIEHLRISSRRRERELGAMRALIEEQPDRMARQKELIRITEADDRFYRETRVKISLEERTAFGEELIEALRQNADRPEPRVFDSYQGFTVELPARMAADKPYVNVLSPNGGRYYVAMDLEKPMGCAQRLDILFDRLPLRAEEQKETQSQLRRQLKDAREDYARGNPYPDRIDELESKLSRIDKQLEESEAA